MRISAIEAVSGDLMNTFTFDYDDLGQIETETRNDDPAKADLTQEQFEYIQEIQQNLLDGDV